MDIYKAIEDGIVEREVIETIEGLKQMTTLEFKNLADENFVNMRHEDKKDMIGICLNFECDIIKYTLKDMKHFEDFFEFNHCEEGFYFGNDNEKIVLEARE